MLKLNISPQFKTSDAPRSRTEKYRRVAQSAQAASKSRLNINTVSGAIAVVAIALVSFATLRGYVDANKTPVAVATPSHPNGYSPWERIANALDGIDPAGKAGRDKKALDAPAVAMKKHSGPSDTSTPVVKISR